MSIGSKIHIFESEKLGEGSYGSVYKCTDENGKTYAVKCIEINSTGIPNILESSIMTTISHKSLNTALHIHTTPEEVHIFQKLASTDLAMHTRKRKQNVPFNVLCEWTFSLVQAVACLHRQNIVHADIKANNVLLFEDNTIKLGDFTLAVKIWDDLSKKSSGESLSADDINLQKTFFKHRVCTYSHRPPECWFGKGWSFPLDVWSLGCTLFEIAYGQLLFPSQGKIKDEESKRLVYKKAVNCMLHWAKNGPNASTCPLWLEDYKIEENVEFRKAVLPANFNNPQYREFNKLVLSMLRIDPLRRPNINEVLKHPFFENMRSSSYRILSSVPKTIPRREQQRLSRYLENHTKNQKVKELATELFGRCTALKSISEQLKIFGCTWIAEKLLRIKPHCDGISKTLVLESERKICEHLSFRLHTTL